MLLPGRDELMEMLTERRISRRLVRDLRYVPEEITQADQRDFLAVTTKAGTAGVLLFEGQVVAFELSRRRPNVSGRVEAIICDICATWQRGTNSAVLTFKKGPNHTVSHLVCADLDCSLHVRDLTMASKLSRAQLREHIGPEGRSERLRRRLQTILQDVGIIKEY